VEDRALVQLVRRHPLRAVEMISVDSARPDVRRRSVRAGEEIGESAGDDP
jgi:hypothetical protein